MNDDAGPVPFLWTAQELADALRVTRPMVYAWVAKGLVRVIRTPGGHIRIPADEAQRLVAQGLEDSQVFPLT